MIQMTYDRKDLLKGIVDLHIHAGPSVAGRSVDAAEMLRLAEAAGYRAVVIKDHYFPTMLGTTLLEKHSRRSETHIFGGMCLNNAVGGWNAMAVDAACAMDARIIWLPTLSAAQHIATHKGHFVGAGNMTTAERPLTCLDSDGKLLGEVREVFKVLAAWPEVIMGTGHLSAGELDVLIPEALGAGIKKILVNHPHFIINATPAQCARWAEMGAYIEINGAMFKGVTGNPRNPNMPFSIIDEYLEKIPVRQLVIDTDSGQKGTITPDEAMYSFLCLLLDRGVSWSDVDLMAKTTPAALLNL